MKNIKKILLLVLLAVLSLTLLTNRTQKAEENGGYQVRFFTEIEREYDEDDEIDSDDVSFEEDDDEPEYIDLLDWLKGKDNK